MAECSWCGAAISEGSECSRCWELRSRMESDLEFAYGMMNKLLEARNENSDLGKDVREAILAVLGQMESWQAYDDSRQVEWYDTVVEGVRGLKTYSDEALLEELAGVSEDVDDAPDLLEERLAKRVRVHPLWLKVLKAVKERTDVEA